MIESSDLDHFKKLGLNDILELSLISPHYYEDRYLSNKIKFDELNVIDASIFNVYFSFKYIKINVFAHNFDTNINITIFNPQYYHKKEFVKGRRIFMIGKIQIKNSFLECIQAKKIESVNCLYIHYKTKLKNELFSKLIKKYINKDNLSFLKEDILTKLLQIHFQPNLINNEDKLYTLKYLEIYNYLKKISLKRKYFPCIKKLSNNIEPWLDTLPFELSKDQKNVIGEIKKDFLKDIASKRIVVGDVGTGKTIIILASAFLAYPNKSILMVPTTVLLKQIYEEAKKLLPKYINIALVSSNVKNISLEKYDFLIGTQALLYRDLPKASLILVDEQHKFGTRQRNLLQKIIEVKVKRPHYIQFSATPIPRTQVMIDSNLVDISLIENGPFKKNTVSRLVRDKDFPNLLKHIKNEIKNKKQILIIYPLIEESTNSNYSSIEEGRVFWEKSFSKVFVTHGKDKNKEDIVECFKNEGNILISTTVIEVGISLPKLSSIIIVGAERLGLASLHQLRGRVGRTGIKSYCFLYTKQKESEKLDKFCLTKNGFDIASLDLKFRKGGDILKGKSQSGKNFKYFDMCLDEKILLRVKNDLLKT